jgi:integrase
MASSGRIYQRGDIYYVAYRWDGREYRESARSSDRAVAERLLAQRVRERAGRGPTGAVTFDTLATWYLDDYTLRGLRTLDTAHGRVANLRAVFGGWGAPRITTAAIGGYQRTRRAAGAAGATVNRETSALSRMFHLGVRAGRVPHRPVFPDRLDENGPRQGFFEHGEYAAVRRALPGPYQDVLDFAYYSGWRKREILGLQWDEVDEEGGVVRLSPARSKTRVGRVLPISDPIAAVLSRRRARRRVGDPRVFTRDETTVRAWRRAWPTACRQAGVPGRLLHDCRRTAARNLVRAGVPERVAMVLTGHTTRAIFDRYCIVNEADLHQAGAQLVAYLHGPGEGENAAR